VAAKLITIISFWRFPSLSSRFARSKKFIRPVPIQPITEDNYCILVQTNHVRELYCVDQSQNRFILCGPTIEKNLNTFASQEHGLWKTNKKQYRWFSSLNGVEWRLQVWAF
jgi:hypothetical protein